MMVGHYTHLHNVLNEVLKFRVTVYFSVCRSDTTTSLSEIFASPCLLNINSIV